MDIKKEYERWLANATADGDVLAELKTLDDAKIEDAFYRDLAFGTGGLRGVIGAGTNRMNIYTVAKASQGLADYLKKNYEKPSVVIGFLQKVWNYDYYGEDRTVDTHVKMLRGHLGACRKMIVTVWGIGYKFDPDAV